MRLYILGFWRWRVVSIAADIGVVISDRLSLSHQSIQSVLFQDAKNFGSFSL
ncbi:hypothetical protein [Desmonostoc muscorum]|uniref:hypothetical protein n=1 Tax=Desmonostoc muscorum TaxID=1179 RepID=UPI001F2CA222|nr:hypothetical protein [Desmonostoc muscorum]